MLQGVERFSDIHETINVLEKYLHSALYLLQSTLAQSFFRFVEAWDGSVKIDGLDIKVTSPLHPSVPPFRCVQGGNFTN